MREGTAAMASRASGATAELRTAASEPSAAAGAAALPLIGLAVPPRGQATRPAIAGPHPVSYGDLSDRAGAIGGALAALGARGGDRVAIWMDKQTPYVEAVLGTLRAGCTYVPLDGGQPAGRVETIVGDAEPVALFTDRPHLAALASVRLPESLRVIVVTGDEPAGPLGAVPVRTYAELTGTGAAPLDAPPGGTDPDALAAILYTSGSTGVPKGVKISHRNLGSFIGWARGELDVGPDDVFANHASFNFDLSTFDLFTALSAGASVWVVPDVQARDVTALADGIRRYGVSVWYSVPSILTLLTRAGVLTGDVCRSLRYVLFAGEPFPVPHLRETAGCLAPDTALYNLYGPTETNVCTFHRVRPQDLDGDASLPIGGPVTGAKLIVRDDEGHEVTGVGARGELVVEGDCVTPGYWRRENEPMADQHRAHRHPTGDVVSIEEAGLVYRGRIDRMVKLNGYRLELGEVEAGALRHPDLADTAALVTGEGAKARLVLFYTLRPGADRPSVVALKQHCARHLPKYMVPHVATCLPEMPRNANGKTDYRRLAEVAAPPTP